MDYDKDARFHPISVPRENCGKTGVKCFQICRIGKGVIPVVNVGNLSDGAAHSRRCDPNVKRFKIRRAHRTTQVRRPPTLADTPLLLFDHDLRIEWCRTDGAYISMRRLIQVGLPHLFARGASDDERLFGLFFSHRITSWSSDVKTGCQCAGRKAKMQHGCSPGSALIPGCPHYS